ncbi:MAG: EamA family transporter [Minwuiales bacterium]|nr:EamA family transporter [Minwuiales bacterium]
MDLTVAGLVLLAALLHAGWNAMLKLNGDRLAVMAMIALGSGVIAAFLAPFAPAPDPASWPYIAASVALHTGYKLFLIRAYRHGDLGQVYPIARGTAPLIVVAVAYLLLDERLGLFGMAAVLVIAVGILSLAFVPGRSLGADRHALLFAFGTALFIAAYTVVDGVGARLAGTPHGYVLWLFVFDALPLTIVALASRGTVFLTALRANWRPGFAGCLMSIAAYWLVIWALTLGPMGPVAALRETSVLFAALLGSVLLKEGFGPRRIAAAGLVAAGVVLLRL